VVDLHAALDQEFFDVAIGQAEPEVPANRDDDDLGWEAETGEGGARSAEREQGLGGGFSCQQSHGSDTVTANATVPF